MTNNELAKMPQDQPKFWQIAKRGSKWSEIDLSILSEILLKKYQSINLVNKHLRTD